jgi:hypothetical protein
MSTRLPYSTTGGQVSESDTFSQLSEYLRLAEECCYTIAHLARANDRTTRADGFLRAGENLARTRELLTHFATRRN